MKKILIIGSPGTGKTTFAKKLAAKIRLPLIHLDLFYHDKTKDYYNETNKDAWRNKVKELASGNRWIIDGNYNSTLAERAEQADTIIFFDLPRRKALGGVMKRRILLQNKLREDMPEYWKEHIDYGFLKYIWKYNKEKRPKVLEIIQADKNKEVKIFKSRQEAEEYLKMLK